MREPVLEFNKQNVIEIKSGYVCRWGDLNGKAIPAMQL